MRKLLPVAAVLLALAGSRDAASAPIPKAPTPPSIDGRYTLLATSAGVVAGGGAKGANPFAGKVDPADGPWGTAGTRLARGETAISKTEIVIEGRTAAALPTTMEYTLDTTKSPIAIDVEVVPVRGKKTRMLGVVDITGSRMTMALAKEGAERPKSADEAEGVTVYYFQKAPPAPRVEYRIVALTVGKEEAVEKELNALAKDGFELVNTTGPTAPGLTATPTTIHFILKRTVK